jgi:hypothetical protein
MLFARLKISTKIPHSSGRAILWARRRTRVFSKPIYFFVSGSARGAPSLCYETLSKLARIPIRVDCSQSLYKLAFGCSPALAWSYGASIDQRANVSDCEHGNESFPNAKTPEAIQAFGRFAKLCAWKLPSCSILQATLERLQSLLSFGLLPYPAMHKARSLLMLL